MMCNLWILILFLFFISTTECLSTNFFQMFPFYTYWEHQNVYRLSDVFQGLWKENMGKRRVKVYLLYEDCSVQGLSLLFVLVVCSYHYVYRNQNVMKDQWDCLYFMKLFGAFRYHKLGFDFSKIFLYWPTHFRQF